MQSAKHRLFSSNIISLMYATTFGRNVQLLKECAAKLQVGVLVLTDIYVF